MIFFKTFNMVVNKNNNSWLWKRDDLVGQKNFWTSSTNHFI